VKRQSFEDIGHAPRALEDSRARRAASRAAAVAVLAAAAPDIGDDVLQEALPASDLTIF
jgi:hypothetical protein